ncbi:hypothetical protein VTK56DRAFT_1833 [Thermocarpiscus australiensis]
MFSSRAAVPGRRAAQVALHTKSNVATGILRQLSALRQRQVRKQLRQYAMMRSPTVSRNSRAKAAPDTSIFKLSEVPPLQLWQEYTCQDGAPGDLTAEAMFNAALQYCAVATNNSSSWRGALERDHNIDPYTLHHTAIPLLNRASGVASRLGLHMLLTASALGYTPSTLSLIRILADVDKDSAIRGKRVFGDAEARFKRLLQIERTPDVLTLQGLLLRREGQDTFALKYFDQAIEAARSSIHSAGAHPQTSNRQDAPAEREPRWSYEGSCHHNRGLILLKQGRREQAAEAFKIVALELDLAMGYLELAKLLPETAPERETYLLKAVQAGQFEACPYLVQDAVARAKEPGLGQADRKDAANMALEWARLDPEPERRGKLMSLVLEEAKGLVNLHKDFAADIAGSGVSKQAS